MYLFNSLLSDPYRTSTTLIAQLRLHIYATCVERRIESTAQQSRAQWFVPALSLARSSRCGCGRVCITSTYGTRRSILAKVTTCEVHSYVSRSRAMRLSTTKPTTRPKPHANAAGAPTCSFLKDPRSSRPSSTRPSAIKEGV